LEVPKYASAAVALSGSVLSRRREDIFPDDVDRAMGDPFRVTPLLKKTMAA
jgi:hypothetical protein